MGHPPEYQALSGRNEGWTFHSMWVTKRFCKTVWQNVSVGLALHILSVWKCPVWPEEERCLGANVRLGQTGKSESTVVSQVASWFRNLLISLKIGKENQVTSFFFLKGNH